MGLSRMAKKTLQEKLARYKTPKNVSFAIFGILSVIIFVVLLFRSSKDNKATIREDQIRMEKNGEIITINENGLVEYRTESTVTYKIWDSNKVTVFFDTVRGKARDYMENPNQSGDCVFVTLYLDGELVTICFSEDDEVVEEAYGEFEDDDDSISLSDIFDGDEDEDDDDDQTGDISDYFSFTPTPTLVATPTPGGSGDTGEPELPPPLPIEATCESWEEQIVGGRAIISNTLCSVSPEE